MHLIEKGRTREAYTLTGLVFKTPQQAPFTGSHYQFVYTVLGARFI
jgi:hypothetical protein